jgi:hypothetical protein
MDSVDADFGASSPVYLAQPSPMVAAVSKDGILYLVDAHNFGGIISQLAMLRLATGGAMVIHTTPAAYATAQGMHVVLTVNTGAQCTGTGANGKAVISVLIPAGSDHLATLSDPLSPRTGRGDRMEDRGLAQSGPVRQLPSKRSMNVCITAGFSVMNARPICAASRASGGPPAAI